MTCTVLVVTSKDDIPTKPVDGKPTLVYWNILGLVQSARLALIAAQVDFVDVRIEAGTAGTPEYGKGWKEAKHSDEMLKAVPFPNLPYLLHPDFGERALVQSDSILRFIGTNYGLLGASPAFTDMYVEHLQDGELAITRASYGAGPDKLLEWYKTDVPGYLGQFGKLVSGDKKLLSETDTPSIADYKLYVFLYKMQVIQDQLGDEMTKTILTQDNEWCKPYMERIEAVPAIKAYLASEFYQKHPMNNGSAKWRG